MKPLQINPADRTPIYAQLERAIRFAVLTGNLSIGDKLPTVRQLAVDLKINANTVAKVYVELERAGVVETKRGVGTFVRASNFEAATHEDRERLLGECVERFLAEARGFGCSLEEAISYLETRRAEEEKKYG